MNFSADTPTSDVFTAVEQFLDQEGFYIANMDNQRPWGGYFVIDEGQAPKFIKTFFPHLNVDDFRGYPKLSPKILLVAPGKRLSWQYHLRRSEIWKVIGGACAISVSETDEETHQQPLGFGEVVSLDQGQRHRLIGTDTWGIIAEIWKHTDAANPSDEDDIIRVQDDFGR